VCIIGYGRLVGKPLVHYFCSQKSTVIVVRKNTENKEKFFKIADVIVSGAGEKNIVNECKKNAILIDFGYSFENGKIYGDINFEKLKNKAKLITPTPGGTGPILSVMIFKNLFKLAELQK
jgi:methylenetetrahydrofolate dehydrogenase (NADP+)/methenyltetrahydrofolate cyclohydrolase